MAPQSINFYKKEHGMKSAGLMAVTAAILAFLAVDWTDSVRGQAAPQTVPPPAAVVQVAPSNVPSAYPTPRRRGGSGDASDGESSGLREQDYEFGRQAEALASQYGAAKEDGAKEKLRSQLRDVLDKQFTVHHKRREAELEKLEARVRSLRELLSKRSEQRQPIVDRRLEQLTRDAEGLGWSEPSGGSAPSAGVAAGPNVFRLPNSPMGTTAPNPYGAPTKQPPARK
jgi:hypothetical protein